MSNRALEEQLTSAVRDLRQLADMEQPPEEAMLPKDQLEQKMFYIQFYKSIFVKYVKVFRELEEVYDQTLQPQKRENEKRLLEAVLCRMLEVKETLRELTGQYVDLDDTLVDLKDTPEVIEIPIPRYFKEDNLADHNRRDIMIRALQQRHGIVDQSKEKVTDDIDLLPPMTRNQAILIIQTAERARQGRHAAHAIRQVRTKEERMMILEREGLKSRPESAVAIQRVFRGYISRKKTRQMHQKELEFIGMAMPGTFAREKRNNINDISTFLSQPQEVSYEDNVAAKLSQSYARRKLLQRQNRVELEQQRKEMREKILKETGPEMLMDMKDAILERIILYGQITETGGVPPFPSEKDGGSKRFMQQQDEAEVQAMMEAQKALELEKKKKEVGKDKKKGKKAPKKVTGKGGKKEEDAPKEPPTLVVSTAIKDRVMTHMEELMREWRDSDNSTDILQRVDMRRLRAELIQGDDGIEEEVRKQADNLVREELKNLKASLEADAAAGKKSKKKGKKKSKKKVAKEVDPEKAKTEADRKESEKKRANEALLEELVSKEIVQLYPQRKIRDYIGQHRALGSILNHWAHPSMGQVRQSISEVILSLGSEELHMNSPHTKSVMLFGPRGTGKTLLTQIIASEIHATLFDVSYARMTAMYEKSKVNVMLQGVFTLAKMLQPAVIVVDDIDVIYKGGKKKPPASMVKMRKELEASVSDIKPGERVLLVGCSTQPWECEPAVKKLFGKMIYTVLPDYGSNLEIWTRMIESRIQRPIPSDFVVDNLSYISFVNGYSSGTIHSVVQQVLTDRRVRRQDLRPLQIEEFIGPLSKVDPVFKQEDKKFEDYLVKLGIKHRKRTEKDEQAEKEFLAQIAAEKEAAKKKGKR